MMLLTVGLMAMNGNVIMDQQSTIPSGIIAVGSVFFFMIAYIIQGANEEIVTRGWLFQVIGTRYKPWIGALVSSLLFALMHGANKGASIIAILNLFLFSFLLVLFILKDHNIWAACGWHSSWNWTMGNVLGLSVSGREGVVTLVNLQTTGSKTMSGGEFGPEGSIMTTVELFCGICIVLLSRVIKESVVSKKNQNANLIILT